MKAAWYEKQGAARDVLVVGEMEDPQPRAGEVRIRLAFSGVNPGDVKKREDAFGIGMAYPRVIPHSDGSGTVDAVGEGVPREWIGRRGGVGSLGRGASARSGRRPQADFGRAGLRRHLSGAAGCGGAFALDRGNKMAGEISAFAARSGLACLGRAGVRRRTGSSSSRPGRAMDHGMEM